ncbi:MAG: gliding motility-associated C-terminal domain-containing protein [Saprospiraceae bacterium]
MKYHFVIAIFLIGMSICAQDRIVLKIDSLNENGTDSIILVPFVIDNNTKLLGFQFQIITPPQMKAVDIESRVLSNVDIFILSDSISNILWTDRLGQGIEFKKGDSLFSLITKYETNDINDPKCSTITVGNGLEAIAIVKSDKTNEIPLDLIAAPVCQFQPLGISIRTTGNICPEAAEGVVFIDDIYGGNPPYLIFLYDSEKELVSTDEMETGGLTSGLYEVVITDSKDRSYFDTITIANGIGAKVNFDLLHNTCAGDSMGMISIDFIENDFGIHYVHWSNGDSTLTISDLPQGQYGVEWLDERGCKGNDKMFIQDPEPILFHITSTPSFCYECEDGSFEIEINGGFSPYEVVVRNMENNISNIDQLAQGVYTITISDSVGCTITVENEIFKKLESIDELYAINLISPNGDFSNDDLQFPQLNNYPNNELVIFNRWGNVVFQKKNYQNNNEALFDGTYKGKNLPEGNYYYILRIDGFEKSIKSTLIIIR